MLPAAVVPFGPPASLGLQQLLRDAGLGIVAQEAVDMAHRAIHGPERRGTADRMLDLRAGPGTVEARTGNPRVEALLAKVFLGSEAPAEQALLDDLMSRALGEFRHQQGE